MILGGLAVAATGGPGANLVSALFLFVPGAVMIAAVFLERMRYRSLHAEQTGDGARAGRRRDRSARTAGSGPPTSGSWTRRPGSPMQVWIDPSSGDRRYVPLA